VPFPVVLRLVQTLDAAELLQGQLDVCVMHYLHDLLFVVFTQVSLLRNWLLFRVIDVYHFVRAVFWPSVALFVFYKVIHKQRMSEVYETVRFIRFVVLVFIHW